MDQAEGLVTLTHRLILPRDANHHGNFYAGALLNLALEAAYATAYRSVGRSANLVLKRVLDLRCFEPVALGRVVEIRGLELTRARASLVVGLLGTPEAGRPRPWMDGLMQFVQVDADGRPEPLAAEPGADDAQPTLPGDWLALRDRSRRLLAIRG